jgi:DNA-binding transcriptional ArsR family regulator
MAAEPLDVEAIAERVFTALADPSRRAILAALAARGPATATDLAARLPITRQAIAKHLGQQFLTALARDWDGPLEALKHQLEQPAPGPTNAP